MTIPDSALLAAAIHDPRFYIALAIAILAGVVRGFSGFGSAQIYIPLIAAVYSPRAAAVSLLIIDTLGAAPYAVRALPQCTWALLVIDPVVLRWFIAGLVLSLVIVLASGWRYHGRPSLLVTAAVGLFSGFGSGAVQIAGPPVLLYWLGTANNVITVLANFLVYFLLLGLTSCAVYIWQGLFMPDYLALAILLAAPFFIATAIGARYFHGASDTLYRRIAYAIIMLAALISMPIFDRFLH